MQNIFLVLFFFSVIILLIDQPDLGQSILLIVVGFAIVFISGVSIISIFIFHFIFLFCFGSLLFFLPENLDI